MYNLLDRGFNSIKLQAALGLGIIIALVIGGGRAANADVIPYADIGSPNPATYTFTAASTGDVIAYFAGSTASYENQLGMLVNGQLSSAGYGLDDHTAQIGQSFDLGHVDAGDTIVFVLHDLSLAMDAYSDPSMNAAYDVDDSLGHNHVYSTVYDATLQQLPGVPTGTYVAFEDLQFPFSDFNYFDETFVATNVSMSGPQPAPEPSSLALLGAGLLSLEMLHMAARRRGS